MNPSFLPRFLIIAAIVILLDFYVWSGIKFLSQNWSDKARNILKIAYWSYSVIIFVFFLLFSLGVIKPGTPFVKYFFVVALMVLLAKLLWAIFLLIDDVVRLFRYAGRQIGIGHTPSSGETGISRLKFLNYLGLGAGSLMFGSMLYGIARGAHRYTVHKHKLKINDLPKEFEGLKIVQISDIHSGSFWSKEMVEKGVKMVNEQYADVVFFTGDLVNDLAKEIEPYLDVFGEITAPLGVFSTLGNHDYADYVPWSDYNEKEAAIMKKEKGYYRTPMQQKNLETLMGHHKTMGWDLLMDENRIIERNGKKLAIIGIQNWSGKGRFPKYGNLAKAYKGAEDAEVKLLLSHDPSHWKAEVLKEYPDIDVTFSGHTHGMQFGVDTRFYRWSPVKLMYQEWIDLYNEGKQQLYVNRGFGYLGFPGRVGIWPEISVFELQKA